jgi:hypothetical protein
MWSRITKSRSLRRLYALTVMEETGMEETGMEEHPQVPHQTQRRRGPPSP